MQTPEHKSTQPAPPNAPKRNPYNKENCRTYSNVHHRQGVQLAFERAARVMSNPTPEQPATVIRRLFYN